MWYTAPLQKSFSFASYWRDPTRLGMYRELSPFLADINNERAVKNQSYVDRITSLTHFVLVMSRRDTIIVPRESSWFGFYRENSTRVMQTMEETPLYREDWLGLKRLRESGRAYNPAAECDTQHTPSLRPGSRRRCCKCPTHHDPSILSPVAVAPCLMRPPA